MKKIASFLRKMTWYLLILMLFRPSATKTTNSYLEKNLGIYINERLIENINNHSLYIKYPENIYLLYEYNVLANNLQIED